MTLGPPPPSKVEDPPLDPGGQSNRQSDEGLEGANIFNNQMGPIGQPGPLFPSCSLCSASLTFSDQGPFNPQIKPRGPH